MRRKAVFLDRDGVLNHSVIRDDGVSIPPPDAASMTMVEGAAGAVGRLKAAGFLCVCVTNQPDVARGTRSVDNVAAMNEKALREIPLDDLYVCMHDNADGCDCRKPKPGMLLRAMEKWSIDPSRSWMVGDRMSDIQAGVAAGCRTILVESGGRSKPVPGVTPDYVCQGIVEAAGAILAAGEPDAVRERV